MASEVGICNLALSHIGDEATVSSISPSDGSQQAQHCQTFYPVARDALLESHNWNFAVKRLTLALLETDELPAEWAFAYAYPPCIKVLGVYPPDAVSAAPSGAIFDQSEFVNIPKSQPFAIESLVDGTTIILSNMENATVRFIATVTDTTKFSPLFVVAVSRLLAAYLAGPIIKGKEGMSVAKAQLEWLEKIDAPRAKAANSQAGKDTSYGDFTPSGIAARS